MTVKLIWGNLVKRFHVCGNIVDYFLNYDCCENSFDKGNSVQTVIDGKWIIGTQEISRVICLNCGPIFYVKMSIAIKENTLHISDIFSHM